MNIEKFLDLFFHRNILIIEVLFGIVLLGVIFLTIRSFLRAEGAGSEMNLSGLEEGLKKILENHAGNSAAHADASIAAEGDAIMEEMGTQIERLKLQLMQKTEEVEQLKAGGAVAAAAAPTDTPVAKAPIVSGTPTELEEKVRELEARLSEYSIIEDDIADLSFYKEETVRLQAEIDKLKAKLAEYEAGGAPPKFMAPPPPAAAPEAPPPVVAAPSPQPVAEAPTAVAEAAPAAAAAGTDIFGSIDDDIMAEFERAVAEQKASSSSQKVATELKPPPAAAAPVAPPAVEASVAPSPQPQPEPTPTPAPMATTTTPATPAPAETAAAAPKPEVVPTNAFEAEALAALMEMDISKGVAPPPMDLQQDVDAILKAAAEETKVKETDLKVVAPVEIATSESKENSEAKEPTEEEVIGGINLDKMLSEVGGLPEETAEQEISNVLEQELDTEKLLQEATGMEKSDTEADEDFSELIKKEGA